jgi:hypothetical protein
MKQKIYILGLVNTLIIFTGIVFKINHLPGAGILLTAGMAILVMIFIPVALRNHYKTEGTGQNLMLYIVTWITCFIVFTSMLFKIQHWPYAGILILVALPFPYIIFLPVFLSVTQKIRNFNVYNLVYVLLLLALVSVFSALLSLNVSKLRIEDSYNISRNYNKLEIALKQLPEGSTPKNVSLKIDEALLIVNDYQDWILKSEGISVEEWKKNPGNLWRADSRAVAAAVLLTKEGLPVGARLERGLSNLITEMNKTPGYEKLAKTAPLIFDLSDPSSGKMNWGDRIFRDNNLSWALIYLDALKADLLMLKASARQN